MTTFASGIVLQDILMYFSHLMALRLRPAPLFSFALLYFAFMFYVDIT